MTSRTSSPLPVVLDVDTGVDDALALLYALASPELDLLAVTCVGGNAALDDVVANTAAVLAVAGADVPLHAGHAHPRTGPRPPAERWHGADGLMGCRPDVRTAGPSGEHAVAATAALLRRRSDDVVLVPLGPMTNVADLVTTHRDVVRGLGAVHFMGGSGAGGNVTDVAEFNVHHDPEAAAAVIGCDAPVRMYGLDVFEQVRLSRADIARLLVAEHPALRFAGALCAASAARSGTDDACLGDAGAVAALVRPDLLQAAARPVTVQLAAGPARGETVVDRRPRAGPGTAGAHPVDVFEAVDGPALAAHWLQTLFTFQGLRRTAGTE